MEDIIKKKRSIVFYIYYAYFICAIIYFFVTFFVLKKDITEYLVIEKLVLLSGPIAQSITTAKEKLYYASIFWIIFSLLIIYAFFFL